MSLGLTNALVIDIFSTSKMRSCFDDLAVLQGWLDAEKALSEAQAEIGDIPAEAAAEIAGNCDASSYPLPDLARDILKTGHPLVPVIRELAIRSGAAGKYVHWGATTQDIVDTGLMLQCRSGIRILLQDLRDIVKNLAVHADEHRATPMAGRTHFQHAAPITFGYKIAIWIDDLTRVIARLDRLRGDLAGQFAGAVGTLAALEGKGIETRNEMCRRLDLKAADVPWPTTRDRIRDIAGGLLEIASAAERIGIEIVLLQSTELQEASEPISDHHVGSSTMPQKRNPHTSEFMITAARLMRGAAAPLAFYSAHSHEREMTSWAIEWIAVPQIFALASGISNSLRILSKNLVVNPDNMARILQLTGGQIMAESVMMKLARRIGHEKAHEIIYECSGKASNESRNLGDVLKADARVCDHMTVAEIDSALDPASYLGDCGKIVDAALAGASSRI